MRYLSESDVCRAEHDLICEIFGDESVDIDEVNRQVRGVLRFARKLLKEMEEAKD